MRRIVPKSLASYSLAAAALAVSAPGFGRPRPSTNPFDPPRRLPVAVCVSF